MFSLFIQLYIARVLIGSGSKFGSGEHYPDPTGFGSATLPYVNFDVCLLQARGGLCSWPGVLTGGYPGEPTIFGSELSVSD